MIKLTDILTKPVVNISTSTQEGIVKNGIFDEQFKKLKYLSIFDNNEEVEERVINIKSILSNGENAIMIKNDNNLCLYQTIITSTNKPSCINFSVYTFLGKLLGKVQDIFLDEKYNVISFLVNDNNLGIENFISCGTNTIIVQDEKEKFNVKCLKTRKSSGQIIESLKIKTEQKVYVLDSDEQTNNNILPINSINSENFTKNSITAENFAKNEISQNENSLSPTQEILEKKQKTTINPLPNLMVANSNFLVGRKVDRNIYSNTKELIAKKNTKITESTILKAKIFNKTRELIKFSH